MAFLDNIFNKNFLEYASYVIKDRAIPHLDDGLKPVQRRILHSLFEMDDGKFHKVANVVGHCMKYHPHGDASIFSALVVLANKELFIDKQGNFGNTITGDPASAARYIECRVLPMAKKLLYNPELTEYEDSYDGRNKEPVNFPAKIPLVLILGAEGIAVGMSTKFLPHNIVEVLSAVKAALKNKRTDLYPDFPTGGFIDVSSYDDGRGSVLVRAKLETKDPKKIIIREIPYGTTTESLINSIESAVKKNKLKIAGINDFTTENPEIEIKLARGIHSSDVIDALYAFTDCEISISVNPLVIHDNHPVIFPVSRIIKYHSKKLIDVLTAELKFEEGHLRDRLHARTLEKIFIEERIYKAIENKLTHEKVFRSIYDGFKPFLTQIKRKIKDEDIERLLKIPIRRISLYDINKMKKEVEEIKVRLKVIKGHLENIKKYAVGFIDKLTEKVADTHKRKTEIISFEKVDIKEAAQRNLKIKYDRNNGYLGTEVNGNSLFSVSVYDRILVLRKTGVYSIIKTPEKLFVDKGMLFCALAGKDELSKYLFTVVYRGKNNLPYLKRFRVEQYILDKGYMAVPEGARILGITTKEEVDIKVEYKPSSRIRITEEVFSINDFLVKNPKATGVRLSTKEAKLVKFIKCSKKE